MNENNINYEKRLLNLYTDHFLKTHFDVEWRQKMKNQKDILPPSIPFIGKNYDKGKILVYASAENLSTYNANPWIENDNADIYNRHRWYFENRSIDDFYPHLHCTPMNDGSLILATAYLSQKINSELDYTSSRKFVENCALGNFGKFSISLNGGNNNIDYASNISYLRESFEYIKNDLMVLEPCYVILPKTIYFKREVKELFDKYAPQAKIFPIFQINARNVNLRIKKYGAINLLGEDHCFYSWYENMLWKGKTKENYLAIFSYLDKIYDEFF